MEARKTALLDILGRPNSQFIVPVFQRVYSWTSRDCKDLIEDVMLAGANEKEHFLGTLLYSTFEDTEDGSETLQVIDGQQRLTTITLMLLAFRDYLAEHRESSAIDPTQITERFLTCDDGTQPKLLLTSIDGDMLSYLIGLQDEPLDIAERLKDNLELFKDKMHRSDFDPNAFWQGCECLQVIAIELGSTDSPQEVFESLNSKGKRLAVEDLVRNTILSIAQDNADAKAVYENYWIPLEKKLDDTSAVSMEDLLCSWIASRNQDVYLDSKSEVFPLFKKDLSENFEGDSIQLLKSLDDYAEKFTTEEQWRRNQMTEMDRWLQGKPKNIISERKLFGD